MLDGENYVGWFVLQVLLPSPSPHTEPYTLPHHSDTLFRATGASTLLPYPAHRIPSHSPITATRWFVLQAVVSAIGCVATAVYFFLDWKRSPHAGTLTSAPSLHTGLGGINGGAPSPSPSPSSSPPRTTSTRGGQSGIYRGQPSIARSRSQERLAPVPSSPPQESPGSRLVAPPPPDIPPVAAASPLIAPSGPPSRGSCGDLASVDE